MQPSTLPDSTAVDRPLPGLRPLASHCCVQRHMGAPALKAIYGVGDNPLTDIAGANAAGGHWKSALVRTGMFQGKGNDAAHPAHIVEDDVLAVVKRVLTEHGIKL